MRANRSRFAGLLRGSAVHIPVAHFVSLIMILKIELAELCLAYSYSSSRSDLDLALLSVDSHSVVGYGETEIAE